MTGTTRADTDTDTDIDTPQTTRRTRAMRSSRSRRINPLPAALAALALILSACASQAGAKVTEDGKTEIRYQSYAGSVDVLQLADALDYLPNIELVKQGDVTGGPQALQALVSNQVDIAASAFFGATAQLVATGAPIKAVVSAYGSNSYSFPPSQVVCVYRPQEGA